MLGLARPYVILNTKPNHCRYHCLKSWRWVTPAAWMWGSIYRSSLPSALRLIGPALDLSRLLPPSPSPSTKKNTSPAGPVFETETDDWKKYMCKLIVSVYSAWFIVPLAGGCRTLHNRQAEETDHNKPYRWRKKTRQLSRDNHSFPPDFSCVWTRSKHIQYVIWYEYILFCVASGCLQVAFQQAFHLKCLWFKLSHCLAKLCRN